MSDLVYIHGIYLKSTPKAYLIDSHQFGECWFPKRYTEFSKRGVVGSDVTIIIPNWLLNKIMEERGQATTEPSIRQVDRIPSDMLKRLIHLCHPDKHDNSTASVLATQWLLGQRE